MDSDQRTVRTPGLYDPRFEHDNCGIGAVANIKGIKTHKTVEQALHIVENLEHRAGKDAEGKTGDGVGIMLQISQKFFKKVTAPLGIKLGGEREYGVGMFFFPQDVKKGLDFDRRLYVARRVFEQSNDNTYVVSMSSRTIVYKGMFLVKELRQFFDDLQDPDYESAIATVHSRFSTNTNPSWMRAHPNRIIVHNGEINTIRGNVDKMMAREETIKENERAIIEKAYETGKAGARPPKLRTDKKIAVIGSGPAGLAAADQLNKRGHNVTVFEREDRVGGLLMYGIPNMKLEKHIIDRKINVMKEEGVTFVTGADVGRGYKAGRLKREFDSIILACGASNPRDIQVPGRDAEGIYFAVDFLKSTTKSLLNSNLEDGSYISAKDKHVIVIGGGDTGNDCVGTSIRHDCASVTQLEMMPKLPDKRADNNTWPEWPRVCKTDYGQEEAIAVFGHDPRVYQTTVKEFIKDESGKVCKAILVSLSSQKNPETGRMTMVPADGSEREVPADLVLIAAGFLGAQSYVADAFGVELNAGTNVATEPGSYATNVEKVFVTGDMHRGQSLVVWAIHEGREAAKEVDRSLMGYSNLA